MSFLINTVLKERVKEHWSNLNLLFSKQVLLSLSHSWWHFWSKDKGLGIWRDKERPLCTQVCRKVGVRGQSSSPKIQQPPRLSQVPWNMYYEHHSLGLSFTSLRHLWWFKSLRIYILQTVCPVHVFAGTPRFFLLLSLYCSVTLREMQLSIGQTRSHFFDGVKADLCQKALILKWACLG